jgi:hypothetical protein
VVAPFVRAPSEVLGTGQAPAAPVSPITPTPVEVTG